MQYKESPLTAPLRAILARREKGETQFNPNQHLNAVLESVGIAPQSTGGSITFTGADPIVPSVFRLGAAAGTAIMAKSAAMASLWAMRTGEGQDLSLDLRTAPRRLCPFFERRWEKLNGYPIRNNADPDNPFMRAFFEAKDGRWVMPFNLYPRMRSETIRMLGCSDDYNAIAAAISKWDAYELELAGAEKKIVMPVVRSLEEFMQEEQYLNHLSHLPLVQIEKIGESEPEPFSPNPAQPLDGIRALGLARVIAGSAIGRAMALHGADVLNIWRPTDHEIDTMYATANVGVRSALIDIADPEGRGRMVNLMKDADVFYSNRRHGFLDRHGFSAQEAAEVRPGIIHCSISLHGETGPWADRAGFDQTAGAVTGVMSLEGRPDAPQLPPVMVVNDNIVGWLCTTGIVAALKRRAVEGGSYRVHVSLTRVSLWLYSMGIFDKEYAHSIAGSGGDHMQLEPELFSADTPAGHYQGVTDQVIMSRTPGAYRTVFVPRGSCRPEWLDK